MLPAIVLAALIASGLMLSKRDAVSASPRDGGSQPGFSTAPNPYGDPGAVEARHRVRGAVPSGPLAGDLDLQGMGRPDAEGRARCLAGRACRHHLGAEDAPQLLVASLPDQVEVELARRVPRCGGVVAHVVSPKAASGMDSHPGRLRVS